MIEKIYYWLHRKFSKQNEANAYSAGYWQDKVRSVGVELCLDKKGRLLEVGCGEGIFLARLLLCNPNVAIWGIDNTLLRLNMARKRLDKKVTGLVCCSAADLSFVSDSFDVVVCINVLFNMPSVDAIKKSLKEICRVCKIGGHVIFDIRNALNPLINLKYKLAPFYDATARDLPLTAYRLHEIEPVLKEMNFQIIKKLSLSFPKGKFTPIILLEARKLG